MQAGDHPINRSLVPSPRAGRRGRRSRCGAAFCRGALAAAACAIGGVADAGFVPPPGEDPAAWEEAWTAVTPTSAPTVDVVLRVEGDDLVIEVRTRPPRVVRVARPDDDLGRQEVLYLALGLAVPSGAGLSWSDLLPPPSAPPPLLVLPADLRFEAPPETGLPPIDPRRMPVFPDAAWVVTAPSGDALAAWWPEPTVAAHTPWRPYVEAAVGVAARPGAGTGAVARIGGGWGRGPFGASVIGAARPRVRLIDAGSGRTMSAVDGWLAVEWWPVALFGVAMGGGASVRTFREASFAVSQVTPMAVVEARSTLGDLSWAGVWVRAAFDTRRTEIVVGADQWTVDAASFDAGLSVRLGKAKVHGD